MSAIPFHHRKIQANAIPGSMGESARTKAQVAGAVTGLAGGLAAALLGSLLTVAGWLVTNEGASHWLTTAGSVLLFLTIPLLVLGACCLDGVEKTESQLWSNAVRDVEENDEL